MTLNNEPSPFLSFPRSWTQRRVGDCQIPCAIAAVKRQELLSRWQPRYVRRNTLCVVQHEAKQIRDLDTSNFPAKMLWLPMCYVCSRSKLEHISRLKCLEGTHAAVTESVGACDCGWERAADWTDSLFCWLACYAGAASLHCGSSFGTRNSLRDTSICCACRYQL